MGGGPTGSYGVPSTVETNHASATPATVPMEKSSVLKTPASFIGGGATVGAVVSVGWGVSVGAVVAVGGSVVCVGAEVGDGGTSVEDSVGSENTGVG
jgi:hypothetical protein